MKPWPIVLPPMDTSLIFMRVLWIRQDYWKWSAAPTIQGKWLKKGFQFSFFYISACWLWMIRDLRWLWCILMHVESQENKSRHISIPRFSVWANTYSKMCETLCLCHCATELIVYLYSWRQSKYMQCTFLLFLKWQGLYGHGGLFQHISVQANFPESFH